jgi:deazaflavin-dependent oxidoreductase (nitroreductase family)
VSRVPEHRGISSTLKRWWFRVLDRTLNLVTIRAAKAGRGPFSLVKHVGRKTGKTYETPIIVAPVEGGFVVELTYGDDVAWYRNTVAANGCVLVVGGVEHVIDGVEPIPAEQGLAAYPAPQRAILRVLRRRHFARFHEAR